MADHVAVAYWVKGKQDPQRFPLPASTTQVLDFVAMMLEKQYDSTEGEIFMDADLDLARERINAGFGHYKARP